MANADWDRYSDQNLELWDEFLWVVAQCICQQRARNKRKLEDQHIRNPGASNHPCEPCYNEAYRVVEDGLSLLLQVLGSVAYSCGRAGLPEDETARRALSAMIERARELEATKELLGQVAGKDGWSDLPVERDERRECLGDEEEDVSNG